MSECLFQGICWFKVSCEFDITGEDDTSFARGISGKIAINAGDIPFPLLINNLMLTIDKKGVLILGIREGDNHYGLILDHDMEVLMTSGDQSFDKYLGHVGLSSIMRILYEQWSRCSSSDVPFPKIGFEMEREVLEGDEKSYKNMCIFWDKYFLDIDKEKKTQKDSKCFCS
jgi:hypothetical protein